MERGTIVRVTIGDVRPPFMLLGRVDAPVVGHAGEYWIRTPASHLYPFHESELETGPAVVAAYIAHKMGVRC